MTIVAERPLSLGRDSKYAFENSAHRGDVGWRRIARLADESRVVCGTAFAMYLVVALLLAFKYQIFPDDAVSRMANGFYVLFARDPHLAAMGFVWNPLQSICDMAFLLLRGVWGALTTRDMAGSLVSAVCMTGAVHQIRSALQEWGVWRTPRLVLTGLFVISPMILFFGGNGMSEALYLFTLLATTRYLLRWLRDSDLRSLVYAGTAMGLAYLARNEALGAGAAGALLVLAFSFQNAETALRSRITTALTDMTIFALPFFVTVLGWATASFVITRQLFPQIQGNAVQVKVSGIPIGTLMVRLGHEITALESLAPLLPLVIVVALLLAVQRHDRAILIPLVILGGGLGFDLVSYLGGTLFPWLRYYILVIPIDVLALGSILATLPAENGEGKHAARPHQIRRPLLGIRAAAIGFIVLAPSLITSGIAMLSPSIGQGETLEYLGPIFHEHPSSQDRAALHNYSHVAAIDAYLTNMNTARGDIIVDNIDACVPNVIVGNANPSIFVIPNDRDFQKILADPLTFHTHYFLVPPVSGINATGEVAHSYPTLYANGDGFTKLVHEFSAGGLCPTFRLYRVIGHPGAV